jgi:antitoxin ParD1/3/4
MKMDLQLSPELKQFVDESLSAGHFASASELISAALQYLKSSAEGFPTDADHLAELRRQVASGIEQADRGQFIEFDAETTKAEGRQRQTNRSS